MGKTVLVSDSVDPRSTMFYIHPWKIALFEQKCKCRLQMLSFWTGLNFCNQVKR